MRFRHLTTLSIKNWFCKLKVNMEKSANRLKILKKIEEYERDGKFDIDVEDDPETYELLPNKVDYTNKKLFSKIKSYFANKIAVSFFEKLIRQKQFIIEEVTGIENFLSVKGGAVLTCNHFNPCDSYAVWRSVKEYMGKKRIWRVIREGNYTNPPKPFGFIMRNCNTLPLSSNFETMKKFYSSLDFLLKRGEKVLIYPEQAMWWNYRKPRPLKKGAFKFALASEVPVIPIFITMEDSEFLDGEGFPVQKYHVNFLKPIYIDSTLSKSENLERMCKENFDEWKECYESFYGTKLAYRTK